MNWQHWIWETSVIMALTNGSTAIGNLPTIIGLSQYLVAFCSSKFFPNLCMHMMTGLRFTQIATKWVLSPRLALLFGETSLGIPLHVTVTYIDMETRLNS